MSKTFIISCVDYGTVHKKNWPSLNLYKTSFKKTINLYIVSGGVDDHKQVGGAVTHSDQHKRGSRKQRQRSLFLKSACETDFEDFKTGAIKVETDFGLTRPNSKSARVEIAYTTKNETETETGCDTVGFVYCERP